MEPPAILADLPAGCEATVERIEAADPVRVHRLASLGILPGARIRLIRAGAVFLALVDGCQLAFDRSVAASVWVREVR